MTSSSSSSRRQENLLKSPTFSDFVDYVEHGSSEVQKSHEESSSSRQARMKLLKATALCFMFMTVEVVGGYMAGSLAVMTDAAHLLSDVAGFVISLFALYLANRRPTLTLSYGFKRAEIVGALLSVLLIWFLTGVLIWEAVLRTQGILHGTRDGVVDGKIMFIIAVVGLLCNLIILGVLGHDHSHGPGGGHGHSHGGGGDDSGSDHGHSHSSGDHGHSHSGGGGSKHGHSHSGGNELDIPKSGAEEHGHSHSGGGHGHSHEGGGHGHGHGKKKHSKSNKDDNKSAKVKHADVRINISNEEQESSYQKQHLIRKKSNSPKHTENINVTAAYIHAVGDLLQSVGVCIAGALIWMYPGDKYPMVQLADPLATFLFSILVLYSTYQVLKSSMNVLMEGVPYGIDPRQIADGLLSIDDVLGLHHLHIWSVTVGMPSLSVHLQVADNGDNFQILKRAQHVFRSNNIHHSTVQIEHHDKDKQVCAEDDCTGEPCESYALSCSHENDNCFDHSKPRNRNKK